MMRRLLIIGLLLALALPCLGQDVTILQKTWGKQVYTVDGGGGGQFATIMAAMNAIPAQNVDDYFSGAMWTIVGTPDTANVGSGEIIRTAFPNPPGAVKITVTTQPSAANTYTFALTGTDVNGSAQTDTIYIGTAGGTLLYPAYGQSNKLFSTLTQVVCTISGGANVPGLTYVGYAYQNLPYTILVMPGIYNEQITMKPMTTLRGLSRDDCIIEWGIGLAGIDTPNEYVAMMTADSRITNITLASRHYATSGSSSGTEGTFTSPIVYMSYTNNGLGAGWHYHTDKPHRAVLQGCNLVNRLGGALYGVIGVGKDPAGYDGMWDVTIDGNIIEAGEAVNLYSPMRCRMTNNTFRGYTVCGEGCIADINASTGIAPHENVIANNTGIIEGTCTAWQGELVILRGWGNQIVNNSLTLWNTEGTFAGVVGVSLKLCLASNARRSNVVAGNTMTLVYNTFRHAASDLFSIVDTSYQAAADCPVYLANNTWNIRQMGTKAGSAIGTTIPTDHLWSIHGDNVNDIATIEVGIGGLTGGEYWQYLPYNNIVYPTGRYELLVHNATTLTATPTVNDTYHEAPAAVHLDVPITVAMDRLLGFRIEPQTIGGTDGGTKTVKLSIGSTCTLTAGGDLHTPVTDDDIVPQSPDITAASITAGTSIWGSWYPCAALARGWHLNYAAKSTTHTGTVTLSVKVYAIFQDPPGVP